MKCIAPDRWAARLKGETLLCCRTDKKRRETGDQPQPNALTAVRERPIGRDALFVHIPCINNVENFLAVPLPTVDWHDTVAGNSLKAKRK
jgi:hypothetical protein